MDVGIVRDAKWCQMQIQKMKDRKEQQGDQTVHRCEEQDLNQPESIHVSSS